MGSKERLIEATIDLMSSQGFQPMGIQSILDKANVTKSNFYYHFKSKEELCLTALEYMSDYFFDKMVLPSLENKEHTPRERLKNFLTGMARGMKENSCQRGCPFVNLATETSDFHPAFREQIEKFYMRYRKVLSDCYRDGVESGEFRSELTAEDAAYLILSSMNGAIVLAKVQKDPAAMERGIDSLVALISTN